MRSFLSGMEMQADSNCFGLKGDFMDRKSKLLLTQIASPPPKFMPTPGLAYMRGC